MIIRVIYSLLRNLKWICCYKDFEDTEKAGEFIKELYDSDDKIFKEFKVL